MSGKIIRVVEVKDGVMYLVWFGQKEYGRTYTGKKYRNYALWKELKVGDRITGLKWKDKQHGILDADSPVHLEE